MASGPTLSNQLPDRFNRMREIYEKGVGFKQLTETQIRSAFELVDFTEESDRYMRFPLANDYIWLVITADEKVLQIMVSDERFSVTDLSEKSELRQFLKKNNSCFRVTSESLPQLQNACDVRSQVDECLSS